MLDYYSSRYEVAKMFGVSEGAVRNWIRKAQNKEIPLQTIEIGNVEHILKNEHNWHVMSEMSAKGRKHKHHEDKQSVLVDKRIYDIVSDNQLVELINAVEVSKTIPHKFVYLEGGADLWESFYKKSLQENNYKYSSSDHYFFETQHRLIQDTIGRKSKINVVDIGGGNGEPAIPLLQKLFLNNQLNSYTGVDISERMLDYAQEHLSRSGIDVPVAKFALDFEVQSLQDILFTTKYSGGSRMPTIVLGLGTSLFNNPDLWQTFKHITQGLCPEDLLIISNALESKNSQVNFSTFTIPETLELITRISRLIGLNENNTERELVYNDTSGYREYNLVLTKDLDIEFTKLKHTVAFNKGDKINIWMHKKDNSESINAMSRNMNMKVLAQIKHPQVDYVMYMFGKR